MNKYKETAAEALAGTVCGIIIVAIVTILFIMNS